MELLQKQMGYCVDLRFIVIGSFQRARSPRFSKTIILVTDSLKERNGVLEHLRSGNFTKFTSYQTAKYRDFYCVL